MSGSIFEWMEVFDSPRSTAVEIHPANGRVVDGMHRWQLTINTRAVELSNTARRVNNDEVVEITLLLPGNTANIYPGDRIKYNSGSYEIASVEQCYSFSGEVIARRCKIK
ncbi:MAG: hypothetical protein IKA65_05110 [Lentisphaeria bacterium]|nr:hypothetical protein [Lentisphaeria bacterium]